MDTFFTNFTTKGVPKGVPKKEKEMTYNQTMDWVVDWCFHILEVAASVTGMTYNEINIWIFVIIEPVVFVSMAYHILRPRQRLKSYEQGSLTQPDLSWMQYQRTT